MLVVKFLNRIRAHRFHFHAFIFGQYGIISIHRTGARQHHPLNVLSSRSFKNKKGAEIVYHGGIDGVFNGLRNGYDGRHMEQGIASVGGFGQHVPVPYVTLMERDPVFEWR